MALLIKQVNMKLAQVMINSKKQDYYFKQVKYQSTHSLNRISTQKIHKPASLDFAELQHRMWKNGIPQSHYLKTAHPSDRKLFISGVIV